MTRKKRVHPFLLALILLVPFFQPFSTASHEIPVSAPLRIKQGEVLWLNVPGPSEADVAQLHFRDSVLLLNRGKDGRFEGLVGVDLAEAPARHDLEIRYLSGRRVIERRIYPLEVLEASFGTQVLELPEKMVELDAKTLKRVRKEKKEILAAFESSDDQRLWSEPFLLPVEGRISGRFGFRRILNGQPRTPHSGEDIVVPLGTDVQATNDGVVRFIGNHFFSGRSVVLDHGMGLQTMYFHLHEIKVTPGDRVRRGQVIGSVGSTGRATGPHLHWGARLGRSRVNPLSLVGLTREVFEEEGR